MKFQNSLGDSLPQQRSMSAPPNILIFSLIITLMQCSIIAQVCACTVAEFFHMSHLILYPSLTI